MFDYIYDLSYGKAWLVTVTGSVIGMQWTRFNVGKSKSEMRCTVKVTSMSSTGVSKTMTTRGTDKVAAGVQPTNSRQFLSPPPECY